MNEHFKFPVDDIAIEYGKASIEKKEAISSLLLGTNSFLVVSLSKVVDDITIQDNGKTETDFAYINWKGSIEEFEKVMLILLGLGIHRFGYSWFKTILERIKKMLVENNDL